MSKKLTHEHFIQKVNNSIPDIEIVGEYVNARTKIACKCKNNSDHPIFYRTPDSLLHKSSKCPYCNNIKSIGYVNDYLTRNPQILKYIKDADQLDRDKIKSSSRVICVCPECGFEKEYTLSNLVGYGFYCDRCSVSNSLPNRILAAIIAAQKDYIEEYKLEFSSPQTLNKIYDAYIKIQGINYLVEMDGIQHFSDSPESSFFNSYAIQKEVDSLKDQIAKDNRFELIRINCRESNFDFIKNNLLLSKLSDLLNLSNANWCQIEFYATQNQVKKVCEYYNHNIGTKSKKQMQKELNICNKTLNKYLKIGKDIGWVDKPLLIPSEIIIIDKDGEEIAICKSEADAARFLKTLYPEIKWHVTGVSKVITGKIASYHNFTFKIKE